MRFAEWLSATRRGREPKVSQEALAASAHEIDRDCGIWPARISGWELGKDLPSRRQLAIVAIALKLTETERKTGEDLWDAEVLAGLPALAPDGTVVTPPDHSRGERGLEGDGEPFTSHDFPTPDAA